MNKLALCIPIYKRPEITAFVLSFYNKMKYELKDEMELILITCGSEGEISKEIATDNGFHYIEHENLPLSQKHNALYLEAKKFNPDACLKIDSDTLIGIEFFRYYDELIEWGYHYAGITDIYFKTKKEMFYWPGYKGIREGESTGTGRFMSRKLLDLLGWNPWGSVETDDLMDKTLTQHINSLGDEIYGHKISCKELGSFCIDLKSDFNINSIEAFKGQLETVSDFNGIDLTEIETYLI